MFFNSMQFLFFFFIVAVTYFTIPNRYRWLLLLCASYIFYASFNPRYIPLLLGLALINYYTALRMGARRDRTERKGYLIISLLSNIVLLFIFKYYNFFAQSLTTFFGQYYNPLNIPALNWLLPIGISFYIFKNMSYAIDVYRGDKIPEKHLGFYALYVAFFPQLLAGPIERSTRLIPQLHKEFDFDYSRITRGMKFILWGLFMKIVIADTLAMLVGMHLMLATFFYSFRYIVISPAILILPSGRRRSLAIRPCRILTIPISPNPLQIFGEGGIFRSRHGSEIICISRWVGIVYWHRGDIAIYSLSS
jgi:alginate O-acetyltransferase complex protein AlgI